MAQPTGPATRARLIAAAFELYTTTGFLRTTTPALAARAGIAEGTIYRHFKSKEKLLNECHLVANMWALELLRRFDIDRATPASERLGTIARELAARAAAEPALIRILLTEEHEPFLDDASRGLRRAFGEGLVHIVAMGKSDGQVRSGPAELWAAVWLAVVELAVLRVAAGEWPADGANLTLALEAAWDAIAARDRPTAPAAG